MCQRFGKQKTRWSVYALKTFGLSVYDEMKLGKTPCHDHGENKNFVDLKSFQYTGPSQLHNEIQTILHKHHKVSHGVSLRPWQTRTHCCGHIVADTNVSPFTRARDICCGHKFCVRDAKNVSDFVQKPFVAATNVSWFAQHGNTTFILCRACFRAQETSSATMCPRLPGPLSLWTSFNTVWLRFCLYFASGRHFVICAQYHYACGVLGNPPFQQ